MRGDHTRYSRAEDVNLGTSPHARGPLMTAVAARFGAGNIPACAGTTKFPFRQRHSVREHPRMRGDHIQFKYSC